MKKLLLVTLSILILGLLVGCREDGEPADNDDQGYPPPVTPQAEPPQITPQVEPPADAYPPPPPTPLPPFEYPAGTRLWILHAAGEQCADTLVFEDLAAATEALESNGITVLEAEELGLMVCEACGCPTSLHFRVQIDASQLVEAIALGWEQE